MGYLPIFQINCMYGGPPEDIILRPIGLLSRLFNKCHPSSSLVCAT